MSEPMSARRPLDGWTIALALVALANCVNGGWMLLDPEGWFHAVPGVVDSGPPNEHFIRDVGATYAVFGLGIAWAAAVPAARRVAVGLAAAFNVAHALVHVLDSERGLFPAGQWRTDLPEIYLPTLLILGLLAGVWRTADGGTR